MAYGLPSDNMDGAFVPRPMQYGGNPTETRGSAELSNVWMQSIGRGPQRGPAIRPPQRPRQASTRTPSNGLNYQIDPRIIQEMQMIYARGL